MEFLQHQVFYMQSGRPVHSCCQPSHVASGLVHLSGLSPLPFPLLVTRDQVAAHPGLAPAVSSSLGHPTHPPTVLTPPPDIQHAEPGAAVVWLAAVLLLCAGSDSLCSAVAVLCPKIVAIGTCEMPRPPQREQWCHSAVCFALTVSSLPLPAFSHPTRQRSEGEGKVGWGGHRIPTATKTCPDPHRQSLEWVRRSSSHSASSRVYPMRVDCECSSECSFPPQRANVSLTFTGASIRIR